MAAGGPENLLTCVAEPTIESAQALMKHPGIRLVVVTGGGGGGEGGDGARGKRAICAGPGNPPVVVDETADLDAGRPRHRPRRRRSTTTSSASSRRKSFAVDRIADALKREMLSERRCEVDGAARAAREDASSSSDGHLNRDFVGKNAAGIARAPASASSGDLRLLLAEVDDDRTRSCSSRC